MVVDDGGSSTWGLPLIDDLHCVVVVVVVVDDSSQLLWYG